ncbi:MAG: hypothetical protein KatS3mg111_3391 [Pirellulaceae bacterium]|nr:MAG: hypothetical protein KatS3mg111_3391 [Pirellulaceae bacterium]
MPATAARPGAFGSDHSQSPQPGRHRAGPAGPDGKLETLRPTGNHKFYSVTRNAWLSAAELVEGEQLDGVAGLVTVERKRTLPGTHRVYNLTVQGEHLYRVATSGVLVHNTCYDDIGDLPVVDKVRAGAARPPRYHIFPQEHRQWFAERGFDIDKVTVELDQGTHSALHTMKWNEKLMKELYKAELAKGEKLTPREIWRNGYRFMRQQKLRGLPFLPY